MSELRHFVIAEHMVLVLDVVVGTFEFKGHLSILCFYHMIYLENTIDSVFRADMCWQNTDFINCSQELI